MITRVIISFFIGWAASVQAQSIKQYFMLFPERSQEVQLDSVDEYTSVLVDEKNAYLQIDYMDADYGYEYGGQIEFTYFVKQDKSKIFGYSHFFDGPSSASASFGFYSYRQGQWSDVTTFVLPEIKLGNFTADSVWINNLGSYDYRLRLELPQEGTTITLQVLPVGENDSPVESYEDYLSFIASLPAVNLSWNKLKGIFELK